MYIYIFMYVYISEGFRPLPPAPKLEDPMIGRFENSMDGWLLTICLPLEVRGHAFWSPFWLLRVALDLLLEALGDAKGVAWDPDWPGDRQNGLDCTLAWAGALFY